MVDDDEMQARALGSDLHDPAAAFFGALGTLQLRCLQLAAAIRDGATRDAEHRAQQAHDLWMAASAARARVVHRSAERGERGPDLGPALRAAQFRLDRLLAAAQDRFEELRTPLFPLRVWLALCGDHLDPGSEG
jgi:hypothetical protein